MLNPKYNELKKESDWKFYDYVIFWDKDSLLWTIENAYLNAKNSCPSAPNLGENGCIEFAGALLFREYLSQAVSGGQLGREEVSGSLLQTVITIGLAFLGKSPDEWSILADAFAKDSNILQEREWSSVYLYLRDFIGNEIRKMEFNKGNGYKTKQQASIMSLVETAVLNYEIIDIQKYFRLYGLNIM